MLKVLFVEDDAIAASIGKKMLNLFPEVSMEYCATGYSALETFGTQKFDLLVIDLGLPDISGVEFVQMIKKQYKKSPPVVTVTAHINPNDPTPLDIDRVYAKPLTYELVQEIINCFT